MSDPIEIVQTVISVSQQIYGVVKSVKGAPDELKNIDRAVSRVLPILDHLLATIGQRAHDETRDRDARALQSLCDEARELVEIAKRFLESSSDGTYKLRKKEWPRWLMKKSDREDLAKQFHDVHGAISAYLSYDVHRELTVELQAIRNTHQMGSVAAIPQDIGQRPDPYTGHDVRLGCQIAQHVMLSAAQSQTQELNQHYDEITTADTGSLVRAPMRRPDPPTHQPFYPGSPCNSLCSPSCRCQCHHPPLTPIPQFLRSVVGSISIDHDVVSGLRSIFTPCNDQKCRRHRSNLLKIKYYCPTWFAQINAEIRTNCIPVHFVIQTPRLVQKLGWIQDATLDEVRQKLLSRELTVNDVEPNGNSVLHFVTVRVTWDRSDTAPSLVALLTEHSAPTDWEHAGLTPTERALWFSLVWWRRYESRKAALDALKHKLGPHLLQDINDAHEELATKLHWTELHRFICLLSSPILTPIPQILASQINVEDSWGWTPLFYAALVSPDTIHALLAAGANPRIDDVILCWVAQAGAATAISMLVRAGAYTNAHNVNGYTSLHRAVDSNLVYPISRSMVALELVRHAGHLLDWDARADDGNTPLDLAQWRVQDYPDDEELKHIVKLYKTRRLSEDAQYIPTPSIVDMEDGSAVDDSTGLPPTSLIRAGLRGDVGAIGDLISRGAMVNERDQDGRTLLHFVVLGKVPNGYRVALELVRHGGWGVNWDALAGKGEQEDHDEKKIEENTARSPENDSGKEADHDGEPKGTALELAQARLDKNKLTEPEREELEKIRDLLEARRLPPGESYLWPCMDPDFYDSESELEPSPHMPGAWDDD